MNKTEILLCKFNHRPTMSLKLQKMHIDALTVTHDHETVSLCQNKSSNKKKSTTYRSVLSRVGRRTLAEISTFSADTEDSSWRNGYFSSTEIWTPTWWNQTSPQKDFLQSHDCLPLFDWWNDAKRSLVPTFDWRTATEQEVSTDISKINTVHWLILFFF